MRAEEGNAGCCQMEGTPTPQILTFSQHCEETMSDRHRSGLDEGGLDWVIPRPTGKARTQRHTGTGRDIGGRDEGDAVVSPGMAGCWPAQGLGEPAEEMRTCR